MRNRCKDCGNIYDSWSKEICVDCFLDRLSLGDPLPLEIIREIDREEEWRWEYIPRTEE